MESLKVAVVQSGSSIFDMPRTLAKVANACQEAADLDAQLVVFPEAFLGGYPKGADFGTRVGSRTVEGREDFCRYYEAAVNVPGVETTVISELALQYAMTIVMGLVERDLGTLYCSLLFFGSDGEMKGKHRKIMPTGMERLIWGFGDGSTMPAIRTEFGTIGAAICWENYMPLFRTTMYAKGVTLWCAPTVDDRETWQVTMRHIALEGRCFVLSACQYLTVGNASETPLIRGGSVIVSPLGDILAGPLYGQEGILTAELDLEEIVRGKFDLDVVGHYSRPDIFTLSVNEDAQASVKFQREIKESG